MKPPPTIAAPTTAPRRPETGSARLTGPRPLLDPRRYIARDDLVEAGLADIVAAARYVEAMPMQCTAPRTAMRRAGDDGAVAVSELLFGEAFDVFEVSGDWVFGRSVADLYTGWVRAAVLGAIAGDALHRITASIAPLFAAADIKAPVLAELPFGARLGGVAGERFFAVEAGGFVHNRHIAPLVAAPIEIARRFTGAPYLWGGRTPFGVDCSGLVQAALAACAMVVPRDTDQQFATIGSAVDFDNRMAGDLVFFPGHVGILATRDQLLHANAHWMTALEEPLADVVDRLHASGIAQPVSGVRRP